MFKGSFVFFVTLFCISFFLLACGPQSRKLSRLTGRPVKIKLPKDCKRVINISISGETDGKNSVKNVTYISTDGRLLTKEYTDWGVWQGSIEWVQHNGQAYSGF